MTEETIKKAIKRYFERNGWNAWFVHKKTKKIGGRYIWENADIFTIFDTIAIKGKELKLIQYTSQSNIKARVKKIEEYYTENNMSYPCEVWGFKGGNDWEVIELYTGEDYKSN